MKNYTIIKDRKINFAVVGCGRIAKNHLLSIEKFQDDINLIAICDVDEKALLSYSSKSNLNKYYELEEMLINEKNLDLVALCTPSGLHSEQTKLCAKYGINIITEKPMATNWEDGKNMVQVCDNAGVRLFVVKQNRKNPTLQLLKKAIKEKRFGQIYIVNINVFWTRPQEYYDQAQWRGTLKLDGGAFMNQASHYVDLLDWLIGPIEEVQSMMSTSLKIEVEDTGVLNLKWKDGTLGSMNVTMLTYPNNFEGSITIIGQKGTVKVGGVAVNEIKHWKFENFAEYDNDIMNANYQTKSVYGNGHPLYYQNVINVLRGKEEPETDGREGLKSLEIIIAAYLSHKNKITISLPLDK